MQRVYTAFDDVVAVAFDGNILLWTKGIQIAWGRISLTEKVTWLFFFTNTIALVTAIEMLVFRH